MAAEVALALMLVIGAGLLASSLQRLYISGTGFDPRGVENIAFSMDQQPIKGDALIEFYRHVGEGLGHQPGVKNVSFAWIIPFGHFQWDEDLSTADGKSHDIYQNSVAPAYFQTMRIPFFAGRDFRWEDSASTGQKIILNQAAARVLFPDRNPLGQFVTKKEGEKTFKYEVIGVVGDAKYEDVRSAAPPTAYVPFTQNDPETRSYLRSGADGRPRGFTGRGCACAGRTNPAGHPQARDDCDVGYGPRFNERRAHDGAAGGVPCDVALMVRPSDSMGRWLMPRRGAPAKSASAWPWARCRSQVARMVFLQNAAVAVGGTCTGAGRRVARFPCACFISVRYVDARSMGLCGIHPGAGVHRQCSVFVTRHSRRPHSAHGSHSLRVNARLR